MKHIIVLLSILCIGTYAFGQQVSVRDGTIIVTIVGLRSNDGYVKIALYNSKDGFPDKSEKALKKQKYRIENRISCAQFTELPYGEYAIGVYHDENENNELDKGMFGIPKEGYGASNDAKGFMGPPTFNDAKFSLQRDTLQIAIKMNY